MHRLDWVIAHHLTIIQSHIQAFIVLYLFKAENSDETIQIISLQLLYFNEISQ